MHNKILHRSFISFYTRCFRKQFIILPALLLLYGCGTMFDISGKGSLDTSIYYNVETGEIVNNHKSPMNSMRIWINPRARSNIHRTVSTEFDPPVYSFKLIIPQDSVAVNNYSLSIHLEGDHWRMMRHINLNRDNTAKKRQIYARFTSH